MADVLARAIRAQDGHDTLWIALVELDGAVVGRAGDERAPDTGLLQDAEDPVLGILAPVGRAVVDVRVEDRQVRAGGLWSLSKGSRPE